MTPTLSTRRLAALAISIAVVAALLLLAGCGDDGGIDGGGGETDSAALDGTDWRLVRWSESGLDPADVTITADFADERISGTSDAEGYSGLYKTGPGDDFSAGPLSSTGGGRGSPAESTYFDLLKAAVTYVRMGDTLTLYDAEGNEALVFERVPASD